MKLIAFAGVPGAGKDTAGQYLQQHFPNVYVEKFATPLQDIVALMSGDYNSRLTHRQLFEDQKWKNASSINLTPILQDLGTRHWFLAGAVKVICGEQVDSDKDLSEISIDICSNYKTKYGNSLHYCLPGIELYSTLDEEIDSCFYQESTGSIPLFTPRQVMQVFGTDLCRLYVNKHIWTSNMLQRLNRYKDTDTTVVITDLRFKNEYEMLDSLGGHLVYIDNPNATQKASELGLLSHQSEQQRDFLANNAHWYIPNTRDDLRLFFDRVKKVYDVIVNGV